MSSNKKYDRVISKLFYNSDVKILVLIKFKIYTSTNPNRQCEVRIEF